MIVKMRIRYRMTWLFISGSGVLLMLLAAMAVSFASEQNYGLVCLCVLLSVIVGVALLSLFNYGLFINEKRVVAVEQAGIKVLRYDDVSSITVRFSKECISTVIKTKKRDEYVFVWRDIFLGTNLVLPSYTKIKLDDSFVERSMEALAACPKVKIQNLYFVK